MGYRIDSVEILTSSGFGIRASVLADLMEQDDGDGGFDRPDGWPEIGPHENDELMKRLRIAMKKGRGGDLLLLDRVHWSGEGASDDEPLRDFLGSTEGSADLLLTWAGGDSHTGLRVVAGRVTEHKVVMVLGEPV